MLDACPWLLESFINKEEVAASGSLLTYFIIFNINLLVYIFMEYNKVIFLHSCNLFQLELSRLNFYYDY